MTKPRLLSWIVGLRRTDMIFRVAALLAFSWK